MDELRSASLWLVTFAGLMLVGLGLVVGGYWIGSDAFNGRWPPLVFVFSMSVYLTLSLGLSLYWTAAPWETREESIRLLDEENNILRRQRNEEIARRTKAEETLAEIHERSEQ